MSSYVFNECCLVVSVVVVLIKEKHLMSSVQLLNTRYTINQGQLGLIIYSHHQKKH